MNSRLQQEFVHEFSALNKNISDYGICFDDYFALRLSAHKRNNQKNPHFRWPKVIARLGYLFMRVIKSRPPLIDCPQHLFTHISVRDHLQKLVANTMKHMPVADCGIFYFGAKPTVECGRSIDAWAVVFGYGNLRALLEAFRGAPQLWRIITQAGIELDFFKRVVTWIELLEVHARASLAYAAYSKVLRGSRVDSVTVEFDHNARCAPLVLAARDCGVRSQTFQHGLINSPGGYDPVIADKIFVWGDFFKETLVSYGVAKAKIIVTGCQSLDPPTLKHQHDGDVKTIYATTAYDEALKTELGDGIAEALTSCADLPLKVCIKPHPSDKLKYRVFADTPKSLQALSTGESLPWCDVLICHNSTIALDAMRLQKLVILVDFIRIPLSETVSRIAESNSCLVATSPEMLASFFKRIAAGDPELKVIRQRGYIYSKRFYSAIGSEAGAFAAKSILNP